MARSNIDAYRLGEYGQLDQVEEYLNDEGIELRDFHLYSKKKQKRIREKINKLLKQEI